MRMHDTDIIFLLWSSSASGLELLCRTRKFVTFRSRVRISLRGCLQATLSKLLLPTYGVLRSTQPPIVRWRGQWIGWPHNGIMRCGIISSCQSAAISEIVKRSWACVHRGAALYQVPDLYLYLFHGKCSLATWQDLLAYLTATCIFVLLLNALLHSWFSFRMLRCL